MLIFISHSSQDKPFARRLKETLEARGLRVWLDEAEIRVGQSIPLEISRALDETEVFCLVLSAHSSASGWVERELGAFLPRMISGLGTLLPCKLDAHPAPRLVADIKYADFSASYEAGVQHILDAVKVKERIDLNVALQQTRQRLLSNFTLPNIAFFVHHFSKTWFYMRYTDTPGTYPKILHALVEESALEETPDRHEILYSLTKKGVELRELLRKDTPEELLETFRQTDAKEGRFPSPSRKSD